MYLPTTLECSSAPQMHKPIMHTPVKNDKIQGRVGGLVVKPQSVIQHFLQEPIPAHSHIVHFGEENISRTNKFGESANDCRKGATQKGESRP